MQGKHTQHWRIAAQRMLARSGSAHNSSGSLGQCSPNHADVRRDSSRWVCRRSSTFHGIRESLAVERSPEICCVIDRWMAVLWSADAETGLGRFSGASGGARRRAPTTSSGGRPASRRLEGAVGRDRRLSVRVGRDRSLGGRSLGLGGARYSIRMPEHIMRSPSRSRGSSTSSAASGKSWSSIRSARHRNEQFLDASSPLRPLAARGRDPLRPTDLAQSLAADGTAATPFSTSSTPPAR